MVFCELKSHHITYGHRSSDQRSIWLLALFALTVHIYTCSSTTRGSIIHVAPRYAVPSRHLDTDECQSAARAMRKGLFVHAGRDAAVKLAEWPNGIPVAFKVGRDNGGNFTAKLEREVPMLLRYHETDAPLLELKVGPCMDNGNLFYGVQGGILQWRSIERRGLFRDMPWCQRVSLALQLDASQEWLEREKLEYQSYTWDDRVGGNPNLQTGISIDGQFKMVDAGLVPQNDTAYWENLRQKLVAKKSRKVEHLQRTNWAHGTPRMRRQNAKTLFADLMVGADKSETWAAVMQPWVNEQAELPYDSAPGATDSLAVTMQAIGEITTSSESFVSCMKATQGQLRARLTQAYRDEIQKVGTTVLSSSSDIY